MLHVVRNVRSKTGNQINSSNVASKVASALLLNELQGRCLGNM